jgi:DNA-directed RNA polymerase subunit RPC12/RpoP
MAEFEDNDLGKFQSICPACSAVFELDHNTIDIDEDFESVDIQCPDCGHEQNIESC